MILFSHPTTNANVRQAALALAEAELLQEFWTCVSWDPNARVNRLLPSSVRRQLARRVLPPAVLKRTRTRPLRELGRHLSSRLGLSWLDRHETGIFSVDAVYRALDRSVAHRAATSEGLKGVYCYEDGAAETFTAARERGLACIYDLPIGYWRAAQKVYAEEKERQPEWAPTLSGILDSPQKLARKDVELHAADLIVVASSFTRDTLRMADQPQTTVEVIPYGCPEMGPEPDGTRTRRKLRVLFVGSLGQRKGLSYVVRALNQLGGNAELTLIGRKPTDNCAPLNDATSKFRWLPSLPHSGVLEEMSRHDVLVFPSLFEGFGLVILEAMSRGLPVIATPNTAGPDIIQDGVDGFIVPIRSAESIFSCLQRLVEDSQLLAGMKHAAWEKARTFTWAAYRRQLISATRMALTSNQSVTADLV
jgi:glycosyltransferase involved in cell wall biosynthesis